MPKYSNGFVDDLICQLVDSAEVTDFWAEEHDSDVYDAIRVRLHKAGVEVLSPEGEQIFAGSTLVE